MTPLVSEREAVLRERKAFEDGMAWAERQHHSASECDYYAGTREAETAAKSRYPLPTVTRPRVVTDSEGIAWRVVGGRLHISASGCHERFSEYLHYANETPHVAFGAVHVPTADRVKLWADLFANPTEDVEDTP